MISIDRVRWNACRYTLVSASDAVALLKRCGFDAEIQPEPLLHELSAWRSSGSYCTCDEVDELEALEKLELVMTDAQQEDIARGAWRCYRCGFVGFWSDGPHCGLAA